MLRVDEVSKTYQKNGQSVQALREISAVVKSGEFVSLIGPSGSGKSTFLLTVGGLSKPSSGE